MSIVSLLDRLDAPIVSLSILVIIALRVAKGDDRATCQFKLFLGLLSLVMAELVLDIVNWSLDGRPGGGFWLCAVNVLYFINQPVITYLWALYADYQAFFDPRRLRRLALLLSPLLVGHTLLVLATPATGWVFSIDSADVYARGRLFIIAIAIPFSYLCYTYVSIIVHWSRIAPRSRFALLFFAVPPILGGGLQSAFYGVTLLWPGVALSLLMIYISIESELIVTDYLTGLNNRRSLDRYLGRKLRHLPAVSSFAVFMLDLNGFKKINDRYGHSQGDEALASTAKVLRRCLHADDFIARYAGDEFVVVADLRDSGSAEALRTRIIDSFEVFNRDSGKPWTLGASIGVAIREAGDTRSAESLLAAADARMYEEKPSVAR